MGVSKQSDDPNANAHIEKEAEWQLMLGNLKNAA